MAEAATNIPPGDGEKELPDFVREELETMTTTERAAVIMLLMGECMWRSGCDLGHCSAQRVVGEYAKAVW